MYIYWTDQQSYSESVRIGFSVEVNTKPTCVLYSRGCIPLQNYVITVLFSNIQIDVLKRVLRDCTLGLIRSCQLFSKQPKPL